NSSMLCCFFQAEDGIRGFHVTGVQTCALPISRHRPAGWLRRRQRTRAIQARVPRTAKTVAGQATWGSKPRVWRVMLAAIWAGQQVGRASGRARVEVAAGYGCGWPGARDARTWL